MALLPTKKMGTGKLYARFSEKEDWVDLGEMWGFECGDLELSYDWDTFIKEPYANQHYSGTMSIELDGWHYANLLLWYLCGAWGLRLPFRWTRSRKKRLRKKFIKKFIRFITKRGEYALR